MLSFTRKHGESFFIKREGDSLDEIIEVRFTRTSANQIKIGIEAPLKYAISRDKHMLKD